MKWLIVFLSSFIIIVIADRHLNANGPFGKRHMIHDEPSPHACNPLDVDGILSPSTISSLNVSTTIYSSNEQINVTWTPVEHSCKDDFIGIYFVEIPLTAACDYFDYEFVKKEQNNMSWQVINLRRPLEFRYYSRDHICSGNYSIRATSSIIQPLNYNEPTQIHLAYGDRIDQIYVSYITNSSQYIPQCQYG
ncbi:unnamed protein product [Rotaria socialis]|uniref:Uncharacterized protein n=1 Tax=Rotaria socialis TaxID=392032 RepID=A0A818ACB8_9BILA|nr:unnamed protein product [Rotaria socialis]CAF3398994.1 unnamed protein product [Rotaria socialis]CAF3410245.1 unnamed protein product [Rotaria socialis]CAF3457874.1 unnamed protein product [Rotaria socialis]CAF3648598.1 unnamed protein product [Rotaria socialis]